MKLEELLKNKFLYSEKKNIIKYLYFFIHKFFKKKVKKYYSTTGIDLLINYLFKNKDNGIYLDVGCYHPIKANNTFLLHKKGWKGINIDIDYHTINMFNFFRPKDFNKQIAISDKSDEVDFYFYHNKSAINTLSNEIYKYRGSKGAEIKKIKTKSLNSVIEESPFKDKKINFVSIDVEGYEMNVLKGFDLEKYYPDVIVIEYIDLMMKKTEFHNQDIERLIDSKLYKYMKSYNYHFVNWLHSDLVFVSDNIRDI